MSFVASWGPRKYHRFRGWTDQSLRSVWAAPGAPSAQSSGSCRKIAQRPGPWKDHDVSALNHSGYFSESENPAGPRALQHLLHRGLSRPHIVRVGDRARLSWTMAQCRGGRFRDLSNKSGKHHKFHLLRGQMGHRSHTISVMSLSHLEHINP